MARRRETITLGIALSVAVLAAVAGSFVWIAVPLLVIAVLLFSWGLEPKRTEEFVGFAEWKLHPRSSNQADKASSSEEYRREYRLNSQMTQQCYCQLSSLRKRKKHVRPVQKIETDSAGREWSDPPPRPAKDTQDHGERFSADLHRDPGHR
jgi:hypothetical protein